MTDILELRTRLLETAIEYERERYRAETAGDAQRAGYCQRQYEQALEGFNSIAGGDA